MAEDKKPKKVVKKKKAPAKKKVVAKKKKAPAKKKVVAKKKAPAKKVDEEKVEVVEIVTETVVVEDRPVAVFVEEKSGFGELIPKLLMIAAVVFMVALAFYYNQA